MQFLPRTTRFVAIYNRLFIFTSFDEIYANFKYKNWDQQFNAANKLAVQAKENTNKMMGKVMREHWNKNKDYYQPEKRHCIDNEKSSSYLLTKVAKPGKDNCPICRQSITGAP